jgi:hypothetical protein
MSEQASRKSGRGWFAAGGLKCREFGSAGLEWEEAKFIQVLGLFVA